MSQSFGRLIRDARKEKGYSQRDLAKRVGLDFTYLSKLENDRAEYPPKEEAIRQIAIQLDLDAEELIFLAGRFPERDEEVVRQNYRMLPVLFRRLKTDPDFAQEVSSMLGEPNLAEVENFVESVSEESED
ncbi:helix-turn-helix transcriptional regulator [Cyanobacteria bacterium FACHB-63]|nr:helix-turn-helix transcriptional regulator [Cyanobacteria bacterium FACHB-63]